MHRLMLIVIILLTLPCLTLALVLAVYRWMLDARTIWWAMQQEARSVKYQWREALDPGVHRRELANSMMPTNQRKEKP